jgi:nascent polypeptide-associated complex subunit alpha
MMNLNTKQIEKIMKQMGMSQEDIDASRVVIEKNDGTNIIINNPQVTRLNIQGKDSFQISGDTGENSEAEKFTDDDVKQVMEKTECTESQAREVLESTNGDIAEAILELNA